MSTVGEWEDSNCWPGLSRARRALLVVDLVESVRKMQRFEAEVIQTWRRFVQQVRDNVLPAHAGRLVKSLGDGMLIEFERVHEAVEAAQKIKLVLERLNQDSRRAELALQLRLGIHVADVVVDELDVYGSGVNLAARLASLAVPGDIVLSADARDQLLPGTDPDAEDLGECWLKHFDEPVRAYRLIDGAPRTDPMPVDRTDLRPVLAILPFLPAAPFESDPQLSCLGELFASEVQALILPNASLKVIARPSAKAAAERSLAPERLSDVLRADFVLSGTIEGDIARVRIRASVRSARNQDLLWEQEVSATVSELHSDSCEVAHVVAIAVGDTILDRQMRMARLTPLPNMHAHALLYGGVSLMHRFSRGDFLRARELLHALQERVPRHGLPYAWLARWHLFAVIQGWSTDVGTDCRQAQDLARRALDLDPESSLALAIAGSVHLQLQHDVTQAEALYRKALEINPQESLAWLLLGTALGFQSQGEEAVRHSEMALSLSPVDPMRFFYHVHGSATALAAGRYDRAIDFAQRALTANRQHTSTYRSLAIAQSLSGRLDDARKTVEQMLVQDPSYSVCTFLERSPGAKFGQGERFAQALREAGLPETA